MTPKILVFSGSTRSQSYNAQLAALVAKHVALEGADVTLLNLSDYPLPLYDGDLEEEQGVPENALKLKRLIDQHHGVFIASPEYNSSISPLLKNTLDWISRVREDGEEPLEVYTKAIYAIGGATPGLHGTMRGLIHLRTIMEVSLGCLVLPDMITVNFAAKAFDENGELAKEPAQNRLNKMVQRLVMEARSRTIRSH
ncbi:MULTISPECIES: NADPH-dependent FMN reductase [Pseudovibrio]|uniref:NADPH-dependent FMN reductase n=1 Tax=Stappiaceae TaxID=2821832 RepID=UPI0023653455|nr:MULTISPECIES: NAD(P)H-dependent oxidoreductase [Pseudovibrio]MDD7909665.1 NAD(P)H-dependent oxidoreductase [Pseudovibrio exalbescens]MDX5592007.1 NAD(P)H-dependent oxidoreductase [Pseudovibrio sp. SPO723]